MSWTCQINCLTEVREPKKREQSHEQAAFDLDHLKHFIRMKTEICVCHWHRLHTYCNHGLHGKLEWKIQLFTRGLRRFHTLSTKRHRGERLPPPLPPSLRPPSAVSISGTQCVCPEMYGGHHGHTAALGRQLRLFFDDIPSLSRRHSFERFTCGLCSGR